MSVYHRDDTTTVIQGDCLEVLREMPSESVGIVITSPPYNLKNSTGNGMKDGRGGKWENAALANGYADYADNMPHDEYVGWQRECLAEMMRLLREDGAIFYNHKWRVQNGLLQDRADIVEGFPVRQIIIWQRSGGMNFNAGYFLPTYEVIYLIPKSEFSLVDGADACGDLWSVPQERRNAHPAPFPLEIPRRILASARVTGTVLDPFAGSGTTLRAAADAGLPSIGIELSPAYCEMTKQRLIPGPLFAEAASASLALSNCCSDKDYAL